MKQRLALTLAFGWSLVGFCSDGITLENAKFRLVLGGGGAAESLMLKATGEELLDRSVRVPFFSVTQERPYNNEIKLVEMHTRTTYPAVSVRMEGEDLVVGFKTAPYEAVVSVKKTDDYIVFSLKGFRVDFEDYRLSPQARTMLSMTLPPAATFRLAQLPVATRANFGEWMNALWDDRAAVAVLATSPKTLVAAEDSCAGKTLTAEVRRNIGLKGPGAAIAVAAGGEALMDCVDALERDFGLPRGVENRRNPLNNASAYWTPDLCPANVDAHITLAKRGGFRLILCYFKCFFDRLGDYAIKDDYPNGLADVKAVLDKIRAAGLVPGLHLLHTYVSTNSSYVAGGTADRRIGLARHFTLARPLEPEDKELFVDENPVGSERHPDSRRLLFGGELMTYESFTTEPPYRFKGIGRGFAETRKIAHPAGQIGGQPCVSEYVGRDFYLSQDSDLQDIVADRIAAVWRQGMGFVYFDGSEGVQSPFEYHVPNAQYRVWKKLSPSPLLGEGAAKAHFSWHMLSGANAFDTFPPESFRHAIDTYPAREAPLMKRNFTRVNFGWWNIWLPGWDLPDGGKTKGSQADLWEYGTSHAAGWDAPVTVQMNLDLMAQHPRHDDLMEVMRRWEDVRAKKLLTTEQKAALRRPGAEHHLYLNEKGEYELVELKPLVAKDADLEAWFFTRADVNYILHSHRTGTARCTISFQDGTTLSFVAAGRSYVKTNKTYTEVKDAFECVKSE